MCHKSTRREFLAQVAPVAAAGVWIPRTSAVAAPSEAAAKPPPRVAVARDDALVRGASEEHGELLRKMLDAAMQKITGAPDPVTAWRSLFRPSDRVGIKVNTLGLSTSPAVVHAIVASLCSAGIPAGNIIIWDRFDVELARAGFKLNKSSSGPQCRGTDAVQVAGGYQSEVEVSGSIGSCFSRIVAEQVTALISVPVLKDHNLAGVSLGMKNFYGAIHNPNKYHDRNCDPYVADVISHKFILPKWRLTVCDGTRAQYHAGPTRHPGFAWGFGGLIVGSDFVAADAVATDLLEKHRKEKGLPSLEAEKRPTKHIATAAARGFGVADLGRIERIEV
jgi:uncharacterized protein (DUF362 family)